MVTSGWGPGANSSVWEPSFYTNLWTDAVVVKNHHGGVCGQTAVLEVKVTQDETGGRHAHKGQVSNAEEREETTALTPSRQFDF